MRSVIFHAIVIVASSVHAQPALTALSAETPSTRKAHWEWSDEQRIAIRVNAVKAAERVRNRATRSTTSSATPDAPPRTADIIDGKLNPELFMPYELFDSVVRRGYLDPEWREVHERDLLAAGLPKDFWDRLGPIVADYATLLRSRSAGETSTDGHSSPEAADERCRARADALARARLTFGEALDRFMYVYIAPSRASFLEELSDAEELRRLSRGCQ